MTMLAQLKFDSYVKSLTPDASVVSIKNSRFMGPSYCSETFIGESKVGLFDVTRLQF